MEGKKKDNSARFQVIYHIKLDDSWVILFKTLNDTTQTIPTSAIRLFSIMSLFLTPVFLPSRHQHPNLRFWFLFRIYHLFIMDFTVLTHLPPPLLEYAEKHIADVSTNAGHSLFRLIMHMAEMDYASDIINIEVKRGVKWARYLLARLRMTWLHPGDGAGRTNPQIWFPVWTIHAYFKHICTWSFGKVIYVMVLLVGQRRAGWKSAWTALWTRARKCSGTKTSWIF